MDIFSSMTAFACRSVIRPAALALAACSAAHAADRYACLLGPASVVNQTTNLSLPLAGTWIGNYNATTNPNGTQTRPGLFGGSGNVAIPYSMIIRPTVTINGTRPSGTFTLGFDPVTRAVAVYGLQSNLLNGQQGTVAVNVLVSFGNFRTFSPGSTYFAASIDVPLESGSLTTATASQSGAGYGVATANTDGSFAFSVPVPVTISVAGSAAGQPFAAESPGVLALTGTIAVAGAQATVSAQATSSETAPVPPPPPLVDQPFPLPTILPPGSTANLLLSGTFSEGTVTTNASISIAATGPRIPVPADLSGDGFVDGVDLGQLLGAWGSPGVADLNLDGVVNGIDLGQLLGAWG